MQKSRTFGVVILCTLATAEPVYGQSGSAETTAEGTTRIEIPATNGSPAVNVTSPSDADVTVTQTPAMDGMPATTLVTARPSTPTCDQVRQILGGGGEMMQDCVAGFGFGAGVGQFFYGTPTITSATLETDPSDTTGNTKIVRITESHEKIASIWLEMHWLTKFFNTNLYVGPFAGLQVASTDGVFDSFGGGLMFALPQNAQTSNRSFGLGVGYAWTQIQQLRDGIEANQPIPATLTSVEYKKKDIGGFLIMLLYNFKLN